MSSTSAGIALPYPPSPSPKEPNTQRARTIGILLFAGAGAVSRIAAAVSQVVLALFLSSTDFGIYAVALGVLSITAVMRAGGSATYLPSLTPEEFARDAGRIFGWGLLCAGAGAALTAGVAIPLADWQLQPVLAWVLWILAARNLMAVVATQARMRMVVNLRFRELAMLETVISILKLGLAWTLAFELHGTEYAVMALAIPYAAVSVVELAYCLPASGITRRELTPSPRRLWETAKQMKWPFALAVVTSISAQSNIVVMRTIIPVVAVGWFFWAYLLATQPMMLLSSGIASVFAPTMARERGDTERERVTMQRIFAGSMLLVPFIFLGAITVFPSAEALLYRGRWAPATLPFFFLCFGLCFGTVSLVMTGPLLGLRQFKSLAGIEAVRAAGLVGGTLVGCYVCAFMGLDLNSQRAAAEQSQEAAVEAAAIIAGFTGGFIAIAAVGQLWVIMRRYGMPHAELLRTLCFGPLVAVLTMLFARSVGDSIVASMPHGSLTGAAQQAVRLLLSGSLFALVSTVVIRILAEETLRAVVLVLPARLRTGVSRALAL